MINDGPLSHQTPTEPNFQTEKELENAIGLAIRRALAANDGCRGLVLPGFGLDLAVFTDKAGERVLNDLVRLR